MESGDNGIVPNSVEGNLGIISTESDIRTLEVVSFSGVRTGTPAEEAVAEAGENIVRDSEKYESSQRR